MHWPSCPQQSQEGSCPGCVQLEGHLHVFKQTSSRCQGPVHRPCSPNPQESAGCSCPASGSWETKSLHVKQTGEGTFVRSLWLRNCSRQKEMARDLLREQDVEVMTSALIHSTSCSSQGSDRQHQSAHQHVHPAGARPRRV